MTFKISEQQMTKFRQWSKNKEKRHCGAINGRYSYLFNPTTIGTIVIIKDETTGDTLDVSDYENW